MIQQKHILDIYMYHKLSKSYQKVVIISSIYQIVIGIELEKKASQKQSHYAMVSLSRAFEGKLS
jgi:hypothetical protein